MGLVILLGVQDQGSDEFAGPGVDDVDVQVLDEHQHGGSGEGSPDADVVQFAVVAQREFAVAIDDVGADAVVGAGT